LSVKNRGEGRLFPYSKARTVHGTEANSRDADHSDWGWKGTAGSYSRIKKRKVALIQRVRILRTIDSGGRGLNARGMKGQESRLSKSHKRDLGADGHYNHERLKEGCKKNPPVGKRKGSDAETVPHSTRRQKKKQFGLFHDGGATKVFHKKRRESEGGKKRGHMWENRGELSSFSLRGCPVLKMLGETEQERRKKTFWPDLGKKE